MKWCKPYGLGVYSSVTVDLEEPVIVDSGAWGDDEPDFVVEDLDVLPLDPGGMLFTKIPWHIFDVSGYKFKLQRHKISNILMLMTNTTEVKPDCKTFYMYIGAITMSKILFTNLYLFLDKLAQEDESIMQSLDAALVENELNEHPNIQMNIKKEMPNG